MTDLTVDDLQKWDYFAVSCEGSDLQTTLNRCGAEGWHLVTAERFMPMNRVSESVCWTCIFKRMRL